MNVKTVRKSTESNLSPIKGRRGKRKERWAGKEEKEEIFPVNDSKLPNGVIRLTDH